MRLGLILVDIIFFKKYPDHGIMKIWIDVITLNDSGRMSGQ